MLKILYWIPTLIFWLAFGILIVLFHPILMIGKTFFPQYYHKFSDVFMILLKSLLIIVGNHISFKNPRVIPNDRPVIIVSNHQSMYDIVAIALAFKSNQAKFISKASLSRGIPSVSYNIRHGGSVSIEQNNLRSALRKIEIFSKNIIENNHAAVIFPEGERARDGILKPFKTMGLLKLLKCMPEAIVVPVVLDNFWPFERWICTPIPFGTKMNLHTLQSIERDIPDSEIVKSVELKIKEKLDSLRDVS